MDYKKMYEAQVKKTEQLERSVHEYEVKVKEVQSENYDLHCNNGKLQEQLESLQVAHIDMKCEITGLSLTEDDLYRSLEIGRLICESAYDELDDDDKKTRKELTDEIKELKATILARDEELGDIEENVFPGYDEDIKKLKEEIASRKSLCDHFEMLNKEHYDELQKVKFKAMRSISKLAREKKDLKKENERMSTYLESREIKYCDKCRKYGDYDDGYGDFVYNDDTCQYICHECVEEKNHLQFLVDQVKC